MFRVFLIDDEPWVLMGLERLIDWTAAGFQVLATFDRARIAWERIQEEKPDVVLADIRMPGMTGLELMQRIREANLATEVILVSAFADFSYAQEAIRNGAFEYLLKPVQREQLTACMEKLAERLKHQRDAESREKAAKAIEALRKCRSMDEALQALTGRQPGKGHTAAAVVCSRELAERMPERIPGTAESASFRMNEEETAFLCALEGSEEQLEQGIRQNLGPEGGSGRYGICLERREKATPDALLWHARMARMTAGFTGKQGMCYGPESAGYAEEKALFTALEYRQDDLIAGHLQRLRMAVTEGELQLDRLTTLLWNMDRHRQQTLKEPALFSAPMDRYSDLLSAFHSDEELFSHLEKELCPRSENSLAAVVLEEIETHYDQARNLADLARELGSSQAGLSQMIIRRTGKSYSELIQAKRMEKACEMLAYTDKTIVRIAELTGYADQFYFSKVFKRVFGMSPNGYRKKMKK